MKNKVGDIVRIKDNIHDHEFKIGENVRIVEVFEENYKAEYLDGSDYWFVEDPEIELAKENELQQRIDKYEKVINELREYMLDIDYKMGWQYANKLDELLEGENNDK